MDVCKKSIEFLLTLNLKPCNPAVPSLLHRGAVCILMGLVNYF